MDIQAGDRVLVNTAAFIGWARRCKDSVPCQVTEVDANRVRVTTGFPYRKIDLWVAFNWIDGRGQPAQRVSVPSLT